MEFLYKLYSNDFFGIGLFIVITILAISFLIILFLGKKDQKNKIKNNIKISNDNNVSNEEVKTEPLETMTLPTEEILAVEDVKEETIVSVEEQPEDISIDPFVSSNLVLNEDLVKLESEENVQTEVVLENEPSIENVFNVTSIENDIDVDTKTVEEPIIEEVNEPDFVPFDIPVPVIEEIKEESIFTEPKQEEIKEEPKKVVLPSNQFSSVYLSKEKEEPVVEEKIEEVIEEEKEEVIQPIPLKPDFDLPKPFDLPKLNSESGVTSTTNDSIIKPLNNTENNLNNIFGNIEEDTYTIEK